MTARHRRTTLIAAAVCSAALLAGCSGGSFGGAPSTADTGPSVPAGSPSTADSPTTPAESPSGETSVSITPSSDVGKTVSLQTWVAAVCTSAAGFVEDSTGIGKSLSSDPKNAGANLVKAFTSIGSELGTFADQLEQLGAPDVPNGKQFTDQWIDASRAMSEVYTAAAAKVPKDANALEALQIYSKAFDSAKAKAATQQLEQAGKLLNQSDLEAVAKQTPECAKIDSLTGQ